MWKAYMDDKLYIVDELFCFTYEVDSDGVILFHDTLIKTFDKSKEVEVPMWFYMLGEDI